MLIALAIAAFLILVVLFTLSLCKVAGRADRVIEGWRREREEARDA